MSNLTPSEPKKLTAVEDVKKNMHLMSPQFKAALPPHVSVEKFVRTVVTAVQTTPALVNANRQSLYAAAMKCASAGLLPDGKEAALVPFKDQVQFMPMIAGIFKQLRNAGELSELASEQIFENDQFDYSVTSDGVKFAHKPNLFGERGRQLGVYAFAKLKDGSIYVEVMNMQQIEDVRKVSRAANGPAWTGSFRSEMERKSVSRRLSKRLPISTDKAPALDSENDDFNFAGRDLNMHEQTEQTAAQAPLKKEKKSRLAQVVESHAVQPEVSEEVVEEVKAEIHEPAFDPAPTRPFPPNG